MNLLKIKNINKDFIIEPGKIYSLNIESKMMYLKIINALMDEDKDFFIYSEDYTPIDYTKKSVYITDLYKLDPNSKKILSTLYKRIQTKIITNEDKENIEKINFEVLKILQNISLELDLQVEYELELDISKILTLYKFAFSDDSSNLVSKLLTYIKANMEIMDVKFIITINILPLVSEEEFDLFQKELELLNISLININFVNKFKDSKVEYVTIDSDLCEF